MSLFSSKSSSQTTTQNYADSFNTTKALTYAPTNTGGNITLNLSDNPPTGNAGVDGLVKMAPFLAVGVIAFALLRK